MKILTINLWNINEPYDLRVRILKHFLQDEQPDCICFQEVSKKMGKLQLEDILHGSGYSVSFRVSDSWEGREEGLAIATKGTHSLFLFERLPMAQNDMQRILLGVEFNDARYGKICVFNTHLAYHISNNEGRIRQIQFVLDTISKCSNMGSVLLCGDLNEDPKQGQVYQCIERYQKIRLKDTCKQNMITFSRKNPYVSETLWPDRRIDYIFCSQNLRLQSEIVMTEADNYGCCSDHYGLLARG